ncbi:MAG: hypothetical protein PHC43_04800 [Candidatus Marinimicrobia bacterium]|nr:hypothetical protein [Candidatus Neomarinimicrobiota bacterium]
MKSHRRLSLFLWLIFTFVTVPARAQWQLAFDTYVGQDNNLLRYYNPMRDHIVSPRIEIAYSGTQTRYYYSNDLIRIVDNDQYSYTTHNAGIDWLREDRKNINHYLAADFEMRQDRPDFSYFDYWKAEGLYDVKLFPASWVFVNGSLTVFYKNFKEEATWNHWESSLNLATSFFLPTRTTLRVSAMGLIRDFSKYAVPDAESGTAELSTIWQLVGIVRIAQSFGSQIGGYSELLYRFNPSESNPYQVEVVGFSPIDDYFGYKGYKWTNALKWKITKQFWSRITLSAYRNTYLNRPVYDYDFSTGTWLTDADENYIILSNNRQDNGYSADLSVGIQLNKIFNRASNFGVIGSIGYFHNNSNDNYFEYDDRTLSIQTTYDLQW